MSNKDRNFDSLTKGLAEGNVSRGRALKLLGGGLLGSLLASIAGGGVAFAQLGGCPPEKRCHGTCCEGDLVCLGQGAGASCQCPAGTTRCGTECINTTDDENNCGGCGITCPEPTQCVNGQCQCPTAGQTFCPGSGCVNLSDDEQNCGACGNVCPGTAQCVAGSCQCPPGQTLTATGCVANPAPNTCGIGCQNSSDCDTPCGFCKRNPDAGQPGAPAKTCQPK